LKAVIEGLKPEGLWRYFYEMSQIPRESKHEAAVIAWLESVAKKLNLPYKKDEVGNIVISKPASPGYEKCTPVVLQGHVDMVCEKKAAPYTTFAKNDRIVRDGEYMPRTADPRADNGAACGGSGGSRDKNLVHHPGSAVHY
jgi:dipeptidase D